MKVMHNTRKETSCTAIIVVLNDGEHYFSVEKAKDLRDRLSSVLAEIKKEGKE